MQYSKRERSYWNRKKSKSDVIGPVASSPSEGRRTCSLGRKSSVNFLVDSVCSSLPSPQQFRFADEVSAKSCTP